MINKNKIDLVSYSAIILLVLCTFVMYIFIIIYMNKTMQEYENQLNDSKKKERQKCIYENDLPTLQERDKTIKGEYIFTSSESDNTYVLDYVGEFFNQVCNTFCDKSDIQSLADLSGCEENIFYNRCIEELEPPSNCNNKIPLAYEENSQRFLFPVRNGINK